MQFGEKRQYRRYRYAKPVEFQFTDPSRFGGVLSCDISEGGLRMHFNEFVPLDTELVVKVKLASQKMIECMGKVAWVSKMPYGDRYEIGLRFADVDSGIESKRKIHSFLQSYRE